MFYLDSQQLYRARPLDALGWLAHGFGTRLSARPEGAATLRQVHSAVCVSAEGRAGCLGEGDALLEHTPGRLVAVKTADCIPLLLADERNRVVAAVHAGWRGTAARIAQAALRALGERYGTRPQDLYAALGPCIGPCCYEVGPEVAAAFGLPRNGPVKLDLAEINRRQLREAGVAAGRVVVAGMCTRCRGAEFHSFRRDRERAGRMFSAIGIR